VSKVRASSRKKKTSAALLGVGLDAQDGHKRLTRGENFVLWGGSSETHSQMQETVVRMNEQLTRRGKRLEDVSGRELFDLLSDCADKTG